MKKKIKTTEDMKKEKCQNCGKEIYYIESLPYGRLNIICLDCFKKLMKMKWK